MLTLTFPRAVASLVLPPPPRVLMGGGGGVAVRQQDGLGVHMGKPRIKVELYTLWLLRSRFPGKCPSPFE